MQVILRLLIKRKDEAKTRIPAGFGIKIKESKGLIVESFDYSPMPETGQHAFFKKHQPRRCNHLLNDLQNDVPTFKTSFSSPRSPIFPDPPKT
jgi:hypothetical protein